MSEDDAQSVADRPDPSLLAATGTEAGDASAAPEKAPRERLAVERVADLFVRGGHGYAPLPTGASAALRRLDVNRPAKGIDAVVGALVAADLPVERMDDDELLRWSVVVHAVAVLSGTSGARVHRASRSAGRVIADAGYSGGRFARLLTAQGPTLPPQVARLTRFLAAARAVPLDLRPIAELVLRDGRHAGRADAARLALARGYYAKAASAKSAD